MGILNLLDKMPKDTMVSALAYVYQYYVFDAYELIQNATALQDDLSKEGYKHPVIERSLHWIDSLHEQQRAMTYPFVLQTAAHRVFAAFEEVRIEVGARDYLLALRTDGMITPQEFEIIMHQAILLDEPVLTKPLLQWVTMMILFSDTDRNDALAKVESMVLNEKRRIKDTKKEYV